MKEIQKKIVFSFTFVVSFSSASSSASSSSSSSSSYFPGKENGCEIGIAFQIVRWLFFAFPSPFFFSFTL